MGKKFEQSYTRVLTIMCITYATIFGYFLIIDVENAALNAIVPTVGFNLSTWSIPFVRVLWARFQTKPAGAWEEEEEEGEEEEGKGEQLSPPGLNQSSRANGLTQSTSLPAVNTCVGRSLQEGNDTHAQLHSCANTTQHRSGNVHDGEEFSV